ncbi:MAG: gamma-glutamyltransferase [Phycisphaerae bacterium]|nr:MAG: gamma-glutamyltransferase [Phycisphaerae bacterium]
MIRHNLLIHTTVTISITLSMFAPRSAAETPVAPPKWIATGKTMMVATDHPEASRVGLEVLQQGGNAFDAACAVSFALGVTRPQSTGMGGGGFLIGRLADGTVHVFDFRERAPLQSTPDMFEKYSRDHPNKAPPSRCGYLASAVPGLVAGMFEVNDVLGSMPMPMLIAPAADLAEEGFAVDPHYVNATKIVSRFYDDYPELEQSCGYVYRVHLRSGNPRKVGEKLMQPELARFLSMIAAKGRSGFYEGPAAKQIAKHMRERGGIIDEKDLAAYRVTRRKPLISTYRGYEIITMPPPSSGGVCLIETLNMLEAVDLKSVRKSNPALATHHLIEAMKRGFADRAQWLADTDFVDVPTDRLTSKPYAKTLAAQISDRASQVTANPDSKQLPNDAGTSHYCIVDRWGNWVVATETINTSFGSLAAIGEFGLILNDEMDDFSAQRGKANAFGLLQSDRNAVEPSKRPLSSMTPTLFLKDGQPVLALGASGGPKIISSVLNVALNVLDYGMPLDDAIRTTRVHHQWMPDRVVTDRDLETSILNSLRNRGHEIADSHGTGIVQAIQWTQDGLVGASDPRKHGQPRGE